MPRVNRREWIGMSLAGAAAAFLPGRLRAGSRPNVVFILTDDHRYDAFGFMDKPWLPTPNMDRLAGEGVHFANAFVTTSLCSPSRASFLTGQYACRHGVMNNVTPWLDRNVTFLELLRGAGYRSGFIGKWHMPGGQIPDLKAQGRVDRMVSFDFAGGQGKYLDCPLIIDGKPTKSEGYITDVLTGHALEFLDTSRGSPFCLYLSHKAVHDNFTPPERYKKSLDVPLHPMEKNAKKLPMGVGHIPQRLNERVNQHEYYEALRGVDDSVGQVLDWLDREGAADNTLVVYAGDNGYFWGEHGLIDKRYAYEEGMRIPLLARWPGIMKPGRVEELALNIDLMPTIMAAAGLPVPAGVQGRSWTETGSPDWRRSFLYEYYKDAPWPHPPIKAVRTEDWKLITYPESKYPSEMYCLADDPRERNDRFNDPAAAGKRAELEGELARLEREVCEG